MKSDKDKILKMMEYLKIDSFVVPSYNLPVPKEINSHYRAEKVFRFLKNGTMTYRGMGGGKTTDVVIPGIKADEEWLERIFNEMCEMVLQEVKNKTKNHKMKHADILLLKFNRLDFLIEKK